MILATKKQINGYQITRLSGSGNQEIRLSGCLVSSYPVILHTGNLIP
jgi:hypothetical protein